MSSFVYYRFPHASQDTRLLLSGGEPEELSELSQLNGRRGFVLAPFVPADDSPILLFPEERCEETHVRLPQGEKNEGQGVGQLPFQSFPRRGEDEERMEEPSIMTEEKPLSIQSLQSSKVSPWSR